MKTFNVFQERQTQTLKQSSITLTNTENNESNINNSSTLMRCNTLKCWSKISKSVNTVKCLFLPFASQLLSISQTNCTAIAVFSGYIN
ncbi:hypothetical protein T01_11413 [Trichinella spiralis]|uniref:Uncharacterized protein n=1 Tax=Trichinella spiralis TaxID=6334 RepID=A0A0V1BHL1_TRISP|nr:hypothetical protein T01_11413 [Trichinella spiralis]